MEASEALQEQGGEQPAEAPANEQAAQQDISTFAQQPQEAGPPPWLDSVNENFTKQLGQFQQHIDQAIDSRLSPLEQALQQQPEPQEPYDPYLGYLDDTLGGVDPDQIKQVVQETIQTEMAPFREGQKEQAWGAFNEAYPELGEDEGRQQEVAQAVQAVAEAAGLDDAVLDDPRFVSQVYELMRGDQEGQQNGQQPQEPEGNLFQQIWNDDRTSHERTLQDQLSEAVQSEVEPLRQELLQTRQHQIDEGFQSLMQEFPTLATEEGAAPVAAAAQEWAARWGNPAAARDPSFARFMYLAQKGEEAAAAERPAGDGSDVQLEQGGASPSAPEPESIFHELRAEQSALNPPWD